MPKDYIPQNDAGFLQFITAFDTNLPTYAEALGITAAQMASVTADKDYFTYLTGSLEVMRNAGTQWTAWRNLIRDGGSGTTEAELPVIPAPSAAVPPGIEPRIRALANQIKASPAYNEAIGKALGIVSEAPAAPDLTAVKPALMLKPDGNDVRVQWGWGSNRGPLELCEIHVDRNDGKGFVLLTFDTTPNYVDTAPQPAAPIQWSYKAIYRAKDRQVGLWSDTVSITVGGRVIIITKAPLQ